MSAAFRTRRRPPAAAATRTTGLAPLGLLAVAVLLAAASCSETGGPNTEITFRVVLIEPRPGGTDVACAETVRITFNQPIDTTYAFPGEAPPRYFRAQISGSGAVLVADSISLSNQDRTLNLPFRFVSDTNYMFALLDARSRSGRFLEAPAETSFETAPSGEQGCP